MSQYIFGAGTVIGRRTDVTPAQTMFFGVTQEWSVDLNQELVELLGQYKTAVDVAPAELKVTGKIKFARMQSSALGNLLIGAAPTANSGFQIDGPENHTATVTTTTVTVTNAASYVEDLGVYYHSSGIALVPGTAASAGTYVAPATTGIYTIAAADSTVTGGLDFYYLQSLATLNEVDYNLQLMGSGPTVELDFTVPYTVGSVAKAFNMRIYAARMGKTTWSFKNKGYMIPEMDFTAFANASGQILSTAMSE